jgi:hypothetical protein
MSSLTWLLLIYTVPSEPSRKRASVWREVKKVGAIYLRDGVCVLPQRSETYTAFRRIAAIIEDFQGQVTLVDRAYLSAERAAEVIASLRAARDEEYGEVKEAAIQLLAYIEQESEHRAFSYTELEQLAGDVGKLRRWFAQIQARSYFPTEASTELPELLQRCETALGGFLDADYHHDVIEVKDAP